MASTLSILLQYSLLLLILVQPTHSATIGKPKNANAEQRSHPSNSSNTYIVQTSHLAKPSRFATLQRWYASMVASHSPRATTVSSSRLLHTYDTVMHGFAVRLTDEEARQMSRIPGVTGVYKDTVYYTQTTRSPGFIGLHEEFGAWPESEFGDGVIIGFIDSGIWPERASFNDSGLGPVRSTWKGMCVHAEGFNASLCNNKLVGAKAFTAEPERDGAFTPRDLFGHGTHVSGTAAGSEARGANLLEFSRGNAWGVAPRARIAMYKACTEIGVCRGSTVAAAIDAAVSDGVDILSLSLSQAPAPFYDDVIAIATFGAARRGVFVVLAGGNSGPEASTVKNVAPWMTTVGAATTDRVFPAELVLGNGDVLTGQSLYNSKAARTSAIPLVSSSCRVDDLTPEKVMGKVVVCSHMAGIGMYVQRAGGAGMVSVDGIERFRDAVTARTFTLPGLVLGDTEGKKLGAYISSVPYPVASFSFSCATVTGENRAPMVAGFSSRGPSPIVPEILKPDIVAPGVNILAAWSGEDPPSDPKLDLTAEYNIISGTSMACPHVAGVAALIKRRHGDWTPAMVRSAIMTTATPLDNALKPILDNAVGIDGRGADNATPFVAGSGLVLPALAMDPGLVYDAGTEDYIRFLCSLNYTLNQIRRFVPELTSCTAALPGGVANLNYPSLVVLFSGTNRVRTLTRTLTKVNVQPETYNVTVAAPDGVVVTVTPTTLEFEHQNEKKSYTVEFSTGAADVNMKPSGAWEFGHISWNNIEHKVIAPIAFQWTV